MEAKAYLIDRRIGFDVPQHSAGVSLKASLKVITHFSFSLMWQRLNMPQTIHYHFYLKFNKI